jgi:hypothetical protein
MSSEDLVTCRRPVLAHHDDRRLDTRESREHQVESYVGVGIEGPVAEDMLDENGLITIHNAIIPMKMKMNGHEPPKLAISSATRSPRVRSSCAAFSAGWACCG